MPTRDQTCSRLRRYFTRSPVADLDTLKRVIETPSRTTVFRALSEIGYQTSCSHAGRYYTLQDIPRFDDDGLWVHNGTLFSEHGTLRATVVRLVEVAPAGRTHAELQMRLQLRVQDTLRELARAGDLGRLKIDRIFLYLAIDPATAEAQVLERRSSLEAPPSPGPPAPVTSTSHLVIEVLVEIIHDARARACPAAIVQRLGARGVQVTQAQVQQVLSEHGIEKKRARFRSRRSRR